MSNPESDFPAPLRGHNAMAAPGRRHPRNAQGRAVERVPSGFRIPMAQTAGSTTRSSW